MKKRLLSFFLLVSLALPLFSGCAQENAVKLDPSNPVTLEIWHYYNGAQKAAFDSLISEFNETVGAKQGIIVEALNHGNVSELINSVLDSADNKVGSDPIPNIFAAYADTAYQIDKKGLVADLGKYLTEEEIGEYVPSYVEEGRLGEEQALKIFPTAKSTEIFMLNKTDWDKFADATGAKLDSLSTIEGLVKTAGEYYEWTDSLTPEANDGKAFYGRDAMANYFIIGCKQFGIEIFSVDSKGTVSFQIDETVMRKLWDNYYIPFINGYFTASGRFRTDDAKAGDLIALVGSNTSVTFFPTQVIIEEDRYSYPIEALAMPAPIFAEGEPYAVQQGAGMVVTQSTPEEEYASVEFLKWFTETERNIEFSILSCYLPVKAEANQADKLNQIIDQKAGDSFTPSMEQTLKVAVKTVTTEKLYTNRAFEGGTEARRVLEYSLSDKATEDAKQVQVLVDSGMSRKAAASTFDTDENFQTWLNDLKLKLGQTQKGQ